MSDYTEATDYLKLAVTSNDLWFKNRALRRAADEITTLRHQLTTAQSENEAKLVGALESLVRGYVNLLEAGADRITSLGGDCDPVSIMERNDPRLRDARTVLAAHRKGAQP